MAGRNGNSGGVGSQWSLVIATVVLMLTMLGGFWSLADPRGAINKLEKDHDDFKQEVRRVYVNKEENKTWRDSTERLISRIEKKADTLDAEIHTYSAKDALNALQGRIVDIERWVREPAKRPEVQINPTTIAPAR